MGSRLDRDRLSNAEEKAGSQAGVSQGLSTADLVQTVTVVSYPTSPSSYYGVEKLLIDGTEAEGTPGAFTPVPSRVYYAYNLGTATPPPGTKVIVHECGGRRVFRYDG